MYVSAFTLSHFYTVKMEKDLDSWPMRKRKLIFGTARKQETLNFYMFRSRNYKICLVVDP